MSLIAPAKIEASDIYEIVTIVISMLGLLVAVAFGVIQVNNESWKERLERWKEIIKKQASNGKRGQVADSAEEDDMFTTADNRKSFEEQVSSEHASLRRDVEALKDPGDKFKFY